MKRFTFTRNATGTIDFAASLPKFIAASKDEPHAVSAKEMAEIDNELLRRAQTFSNTRKRGMADAWDALIEASRIEGSDEHALVKAHFCSVVDLVRRHD